MPYLDRTFNSANPIVRYAHRARLKASLQIVVKRPGTKVLDFGCGDAFFLNRLAETDRGGTLSLFGFEPYMAAIEDNRFPVFRDWSGVKKVAPFDIVTCFETLEHFSAARQRDALQRMHSVLNPGGSLILSVPIEGGLPSLLKNIIRAYRYYWTGTFTLRNIVRSLLWQPIPELRGGDAYLGHMGFYYTDLESIIRENFNISRRTLSPFPRFGANLNSQVFYSLETKRL